MNSVKIFLIEKKVNLQRRPTLFAIVDKLQIQGTSTWYFKTFPGHPFPRKSRGGDNDHPQIWAVVFFFLKHLVYILDTPRKFRANSADWLRIRCELQKMNTVVRLCSETKIFAFWLPPKHWISQRFLFVWTPNLSRIQNDNWSATSKTRNSYTRLIRNCLFPAISFIVWSKQVSSSWRDTAVKRSVIFLRAYSHQKPIEGWIEPMHCSL